MVVHALGVGILSRCDRVEDLARADHPGGVPFLGGLDHRRTDASLAHLPSCPSFDQRPTMSRIETMPKVSSPSNTTRWRKPSEVIAFAACWRDEPGSMVIASGVKRSATCKYSALRPDAGPFSTSRSVIIPGRDPRVLRLDDRRADVPLGHPPSRFRYRLLRSHREDVCAHHVAYAHRILYWHDSSFSIPANNPAAATYLRRLA